jgi:hypothetical protein
MEIDQEPEPALCQLHVRQQLGFVNRQDSVHALEFDNYRVLNHDIHSITAIESYSCMSQGEELASQNGDLATAIRGKGILRRLIPADQGQAPCGLR